MSNKKKILVYHVGARDHYSIAKYFARQNELMALITDIWINANTLLVPKKLKNILSRRYDQNLKNQSIKSYSAHNILFTFLTKRKLKSTFEKWLFHDKYFTKFTLDKIQNYKWKPEILWGFTNANLEVLQYYKNQDIYKIHNQVDPGIEYYEIQQEIWKNNKNYEDKPQELNMQFRNRISEEWHLADLVIVNSEYSKKSLVKHGVEACKIEILPLIAEQVKIYTQKKFNKKLKVAFVGNINLIKGFLLFIKVAEKLYENMDFVAIGNFQLKQEVKDNTSTFITYTGHLSKIEMIEWYEKIDILIFPSLCDGFGMVQLEAMKNGIPVLATLNCGEVVSDDFNGRIIQNEFDVVETLNYLNFNREELTRYSKNALKTVEQFSEKEFGKRLNLIFERRNIWN